MTVSTDVSNFYSSNVVEYLQLKLAFKIIMFFGNYEILVENFIKHVYWKIII